MRAERPRRRLRSTLYFCIGVALLAGAIWFAIRQTEVTSGALASLRTAPPLLLVAALVLPLVNWLLTSGAFWAMTGLYGRVRFSEMAGLIGSAWLLNLLPMRPGLIGRVAYHKKVHGISYKNSVKILVMTTTCTAAAMACLLVMTIVASRTTGLLAASAFVFPAAIGAVCWRLLLRFESRSIAWRSCATFAFRYADMMVWTVRYLLVFDLIGHELDLVSAMAISVTSQAASLAPIQVGLREWVVGMTRTLLPSVYILGQGTATSTDAGVDAAAVGVTADLLNRLAEVACTIPVGAVSTMWAVRSAARHASARQTRRDDEPL